MLAWILHEKKMSKPPVIPIDQKCEQWKDEQHQRMQESSEKKKELRMYLDKRKRMIVCTICMNQMLN